ncbi:prolyl oligopeptidase family serine peptidase [Streptacidiphilus sp. N1-3]|uniref:Prolyl oligopeptidase family serine peptidase n=1 Tax=Streptacidiphilus alkalitolerans TaxID=3342712 RepID=A0ABV6XCS9_9ACTN
MTAAEAQVNAELLVNCAMAQPPAISPDGALVAYAVSLPGPNGGRSSQLWLSPSDGSSPPLAAAPGVPCQHPRWAPDSASLLFRSLGQLNRIRTDGTDGGVPEALTDWQAGIVDYLPLADGKTVALLAEDEPEDEPDEADAPGRGDPMVWAEQGPGARLRLLDLGTRELRVVDGLGDRHVVEVSQRPDGGPLAVISWAHPDSDPGAFTAELHLVDPATAEVRGLGRLELEAGSPTWWRSKDSWHLAYLALTPPGPVGGRAVLDIAIPAIGPAGEHRNLTAGMTACPTELVQISDGAPLALFADGLDTAIHRLDADTGGFRHVSTSRGRLSSLTASHTAGPVAVLASTAHVPMDVHAGPARGPLLRLSDTRPELRGFSWGSQERLCYRADDGLGLDGLLILPPGRTRADGPFPLVTLVHGGPYDRWADEFNNSYFAPAQWLATAGYAVFLPNPRGGEGHGHAFAAAVAGRVGLEEWTDIVTGIDLLTAEGVADPDRLGIGGWSHGGFMAAWAVGQTDRFKGALMGAGISDWGMQAATGEQGALEAGLGGSHGWEGPGPHRHDELSPISYASRIRTPVLIVHGEDDTNVPLGQSVFFHRALRRFGVDHEFVVYPREGHGLVEPGHRIDVLHRTRDWFDRCLSDS